METAAERRRGSGELSAARREARVLSGRGLSECRPVRGCSAILLGDSDAPAGRSRAWRAVLRVLSIERSVFEFPAKSAYKLPMEQALTGGRVPCGACRATELGTNAMTMLNRIGDILRAAKVALAGAPDGGASEIRSPDGLTTGDDAGAIISRVAGSPGRRVAGSPGRRVAGSPGRRVAPPASALRHERVGMAAAPLPSVLPA